MPRAGSRTLARGLSVLRALGATSDGATVAELATATSLDRAVCYRLLDTLCAEGFATRDDGTRRYHLGVALIELGTRAGQDLQVRRAARPVMERLMADSGEAVCLAVRDGDEVVVVERLEPPDLFVRISYRVGFRHPLSIGAHGRALAARLGPEELAGPNGVAGPSDMVRETGYAVSTDELETGASGVAAPVVDRYGSAVAAVGIVAPTPRLPDPASMGPSVLAAAAEISARLGWRGATV